MINKSTHHEFEAIGTHWSIDIFDAPSVESHTELFATIQRCINGFDSRYSRFRAGTMIDRMSKSAGSYIIEASEQKLIELYSDLYTRTNGAFTPLIGQSLADAGYDATYSLQEKRSIRTVEKWEDVLDYSAGTLTLKKPALLDFGAAGKGYIVDEVSKLLTQAGFKSFCVDAGGDIYYTNPAGSPLTIGLEHPQNAKQVIGTVEVLNASICASAGNRRTWGRFHHIINPHTLTSPENILSVWVMASSAMLADALATCLFFVPAQTLSHFSFEYLILHEDFTIEKSDKFTANLYYNKT